jgi:hypothetical protein
LFKVDLFATLTHFTKPLFHRRFGLCGAYAVAMAQDKTHRGTIRTHAQAQEYVS